MHMLEAFEAILTTLKGTVMKRSLIALALAALANVAFAQATLTGDDTYNQVHLVPWNGAPEVTAQNAESKSAAKEESEQAQKSNTYGQYGVYEFNP